MSHSLRGFGKASVYSKEGQLGVGHDELTNQGRQWVTSEGFFCLSEGSAKDEHLCQNMTERKEEADQGFEALHE